VPSWRMNSVTAVPSTRFPAVVPLPRSPQRDMLVVIDHHAPRGVIWAKPFGSTVPITQTFAG